MEQNDAISRRNMLETISYVKRRVIDCRDEGRLAERQSESVVYITDLFAELISDAPALDVAPVVHARWIMNHFGAKCSNCLRLYCVEPSWSEKIKHMPPTWVYCPNCGARMDGEAE